MWVAEPAHLLLYYGLGRQDLAQPTGLQHVTQKVGHIPALVDDGKGPTLGLQCCKGCGVSLELGFVYGEAVGVPDVPAHGRRGRHIGWSSHCLDDYRQGEEGACGAAQIGRGRNIGIILVGVVGGT